MNRGIQFQLIDTTKARRIDAVPDCRESYTSFAEAEGGWMVTVPPVADISEPGFAGFAPNACESQGFVSSAWEVGHPEPPKDWHEVVEANLYGQGVPAPMPQELLSDHDVCRDLIGMEEVHGEDLVERTKRQKLEELKLQVMAQNPTGLMVQAHEAAHHKVNPIVDFSDPGKFKDMKVWGKDVKVYGTPKVAGARKAYQNLKLMQDAMVVYHESRAPEEERVEFVCPITGIVHWVAKSKLAEVQQNFARHFPVQQNTYVTPAPVEAEVYAMLPLDAPVQTVTVNAAATSPASLDVYPPVYGLKAPGWEPKVREGLPKCEQRWKRMEMVSGRGDLVAGVDHAEGPSRDAYQELKSGYGVSYEMKDQPAGEWQHKTLAWDPAYDISTPKGGDGLGLMDDMQYFRNSLFQALRFPKEALEAN